MKQKDNDDVVGAPQDDRQQSDVDGVRAIKTVALASPSYHARRLDRIPPAEDCVLVRQKEQGFTGSSS